MRTYKCETLEQYIQQLSCDLEILKLIHLKGSEESFNVDNFHLYRDTYENHSDILSKHREALRHKRRSDIALCAVQENKQSED